MSTVLGIRVSDTIRAAVEARARHRGESVADVMREAICLLVSLPADVKPARQRGAQRRLDRAGMPCDHPRARVIRGLCLACGTILSA